MKMNGIVQDEAEEFVQPERVEPWLEDRATAAVLILFADSYGRLRNTLPEAMIDAIAAGSLPKLERILRAAAGMAVALSERSHGNLAGAAYIVGGIVMRYGLDRRFVAETMGRALDEVQGGFEDPCLEAGFQAMTRCLEHPTGAFRSAALIAEIRG